MPSWSMLDDRHIWELVAYITSLNTQQVVQSAFATIFNDESWLYAGLLNQQSANINATGKPLARQLEAEQCG